MEVQPLKRTTKQKIADESLQLFAKHGFQAVSVRDIARQVGIKESSLYNHYKNKQDIFNCIVEDCTEVADRFFADLNIEYAVTDTVSDEDFLSMSIGIFQFYLQEDKLVKFRQMLTIEQFSNPTLSALFRRVFIDNNLAFHAELFRKLIDSGIFIEADSELMALQFYAPIFMMFYQFDDVTEQASDMLITHVIEFQKIYEK